MLLDESLEVNGLIVIGPQPSADYLEELAEEGVKTVINLSRKGELDQELDPDEEKDLVESLGMHYMHLPLSPLTMKSADAAELCKSLSKRHFPAFIHCRLGQRAVPMGLIMAGSIEGMSADETLEHASDLGIEWHAPMLMEFVRASMKKIDATAH